MIGAVLGLMLAATPPHYGGELRLLAPAAALAADPSKARTPLELALTRATCEPLYQLEGAALARDAAQLPESEGPLRLEIDLRSSEPKVDARRVVAAIERATSPGSPYRALALPFSAPPRARGDQAIDVAFAFAYPDWPSALADAGVCAAPGPYRGTFAQAASKLQANASCADGRPYADSLRISAATPRTAARALASGGAELALMPLPAPAIESVGPFSVATYFVVSPRRPQLASSAAWLAQNLDRAELVRVFVRGPARPTYGLLAPSVEPAPAPPVQRAAVALPSHLPGTLLVDSSLEQRAAAERLQVRLHDAGIELRVVALPRAEFEARIASGDYDAALVSIPALPEAGLNLAQVLLLEESEAQVAAELAAIGALPTPEARRARARARAAELLGEIPVVPLYAQALAVSARPGVHGVAFDAAGALDLGDIWIEEPR